MSGRSAVTLLTVLVSIYMNSFVAGANDYNRNRRSSMFGVKMTYPRPQRLAPREKCPASYGYMCVSGNTGKRSGENKVFDKIPLKEYLLGQRQRTETVSNTNDQRPQYLSDDLRSNDNAPIDPRGLLLEWLKELPKNFFNIRNRLRFAHIFRDARSNSDVVRRLMDASQANKLYRSARHSLGKPLHPTARFRPRSG